VSEFLLEAIRADALAEVCRVHGSVAGDVPGRA
jgi:hypothetical protein